MNVPPGGPPWNPAAVGVRELVDGTLLKAEQRAREAVPQVETTRDVTVGEPLMVLEIESRTASFVVVGSRGLGAFGSLLLGSTAVHLTSHGGCPLLVVRGGRTRAVPYCWRSTARRQARKPWSAFAETSLRGVNLVALRVWNTLSERAYKGPGDPLNVMVDIERLREEEQRSLDETLSPWQEHRPQVTVRRRLVRSWVRPALIEASSEAQLVVAGARGRSGFAGLLLGSVGQAALNHAPAPSPWSVESSGRDRLAGDERRGTDRA